MSNESNVNDSGAIVMELGPQSKAWLEELVVKTVARLGTAPAATPARDTGGQRGSAPRGAPTTFPNYGRSKGAPIAGATAQDLEYYANGARRSIADPAKAKWHDNERALLAAIEAEQARQSGGSGGSAGGPPDDDGIPF